MGQLEVMGSVINVTNLRRNNTDTEGDYLGTMRSFPYIQVHPKKLNCGIPRFVVPPPVDLVCFEVTLKSSRAAH